MNIFVHATRLSVEFAWPGNDTEWLLRDCAVNTRGMYTDHHKAGQRGSTRRGRNAQVDLLLLGHSAIPSPAASSAERAPKTGVL